MTSATVRIVVVAVAAITLLTHLPTRTVMAKSHSPRNSFWISRRDRHHYSPLSFWGQAQTGPQSPRRQQHRPEHHNIYDSDASIASNIASIVVRGGAAAPGETGTKRSKETDSSPAPGEEAEQLYLPGLLDAVIDRPSKVRQIKRKTNKPTGRRSHRNGMLKWLRRG